MADTNEANTTESFDSDRQRLGMVYAKALLDAAGDQVDLVMEELDSFVDDVLAHTPKLQNALSSPRLAVEEKNAILDKAFGERMNPTLLRFLKVVVAHERGDCYRDIRNAAQKLYNERRGRVEVVVKTAQPLDAGDADNIRQRLAGNLGREVIVDYQVDPELIGGLVVRVGDTVFDGSVANRLHRMRDVARQQTTQTIRNSLQRFTE